MTKTRRRNKCNMCGGRHKGRCMRGGASAAEYMISQVGLGNRQYDDVFRIGGVGGTSQSNAIVSVAGQRAGGRRRRRGGSFLTSALVPASLLAASYAYSRRRRGNNRSTRRRFRGGYRGNYLSASNHLSPAPYPGS